MAADLMTLQEVLIKTTSFVDKTQIQFEYISVQVIGKVLITI